jgi:hypothetical protein
MDPVELSSKRKMLNETFTGLMSCHAIYTYIKFPDIQKKLNYAPKFSINILTPNLISTLCNEYTRQKCDAKRKGKK